MIEDMDFETDFRAIIDVWGGNGSDDPEWVTDGRIALKTAELPAGIAPLFRAFDWDREKKADAEALAKSRAFLTRGNPLYREVESATVDVSRDLSSGIEIACVNLGGVHINPQYFALALLARIDGADCYPETASLVLRRNGVEVGFMIGLKTGPGYRNDSDRRV